MAKNTPKFLIIHSEASPIITNAPRLEVVNQEHRRRGFNKSDLGYYVGYGYFIEKNGKLIQTRVDTEEGCHTIGYNTSSLSICMAGNGDMEWPTKEQVETLKKWINEKAKQYSIPKEKILPHRKFLKLFEKTCYGSLLTDDWAANLLEKPAKIEEIKKIAEIKQQLTLIEKIVELLRKLNFFKK